MSPKKASSRPPAPGSRPGIGVDARGAPYPTPQNAVASHRVRVENQRPNQIDNVIVTSRSTKGHYSFSGVQQTWIKDFGLIPSKSGMVNRQHIKDEPVDMTATGTAGQQDVIATTVKFKYANQTRVETVQGVDYLMEVC